MIDPEISHLEDFYVSYVHCWNIFERAYQNVSAMNFTSPISSVEPPDFCIWHAQTFILIIF